MRLIRGSPTDWPFWILLVAILVFVASLVVADLIRHAGPGF